MFSSLSFRIASFLPRSWRPTTTQEVTGTSTRFLQDMARASAGAVGVRAGSAATLPDATGAGAITSVVAGASARGLAAASTQSTGTTAVAAESRSTALNASGSANGAVEASGASYGALDALQGVSRGLPQTYQRARPARVKLRSARVLLAPVRSRATLYPRRNVLRRIS